jgi:hypothetical protein
MSEHRNPKVEIRNKSEARMRRQMSDYFSIPYFSVASDYFSSWFFGDHVQEVSNWARRIE